MPSLLIDQHISANKDGADHPGTNDLDIALSIALLDEQRYTEISHRLRQEGFGPDENAKGTCQRIHIELDGHTLAGEEVTRTIPVCGPAAFTVLKALAFGDRGEPKDAYDLIYVLRATDGAPGSIADRLAGHAREHGQIVAGALGLLRRDFSDAQALGPQRAAAFEVIDSEDRDAVAADAHGYVDDLLGACHRRGLLE